MKSTLQEINGIIKATETARTKLKIERDKTIRHIRSTNTEQETIENRIKQEVLMGDKAKDYKNETQRKLAVSALLETDFDYIALQAKEERLSEELQETEYRLRDNLSEIHFQKREYELNRLAWQAEIAERG
jgi:hypothetical protein